MDGITDIYNNNSKNIPTDDNYKSFNDFIFSNDTKIIGKLLHRFEYFLKIKDLPGDIVELGVFKGSGMATFSKFVDVYCPNSNKKIIGFDIFDTDASEEILDKDGDFDKTQMKKVYSRTITSELTLQSVKSRLDNMNIHEKYILVKGDVEETLPKFLIENPGFRISLLYIDVDIERPTYNGLKYLWDRILPGGIILFDEFEYHKFTESNGVDKFLKEHNIPFDLKSTNWMAPTAYLIKK
ncbi:MAG: hypothetical protein Gaeavirus20_9 [Gaeavirus sp.]|uniref:Uncharacterized protein n=1 Tax=Gaeavirus sp. TaxID=2487767 RepID=A0A3G5A171_9VIRU|nr:MAG: hypothetical protein Gaeavirus20_9 [Gaeavirus sp.]